MFENLLDLFDRDSKNEQKGTRRGGLRGLFDQLVDHEDGPEPGHSTRSRRATHHDDYDYQISRHRRQRDSFDFE
jgi:hypothetical protein